MIKVGNIESVSTSRVQVTAGINKKKFTSLIDEKQWTAKEFHDRWKSKYGFSMKYNNFMELLNNKVNWKLVYAFAIAEMLEININELFIFNTGE
ncbi:hypothetical protein D0469_19325 [Peribacillus saganii]|uniref:XRE family transcriptional regulator n=1 Tax=Peribacillus saganii TaxID=2303992 RepID=A0A372LCF3_9BACI|nr:hypothetical protein [Peribacillus saganii]RFU63679.1 hypothetical protein D0469_19325 [Peribacillus saganii]